MKGGNINFKIMKKKYVKPMLHDANMKCRTALLGGSPTKTDLKMSDKANIGLQHANVKSVRFYDSGSNDDDSYFY